MPSLRCPVILALVAATACAPSRFGWEDAAPVELDAYLDHFATAVGDHFDRRWSRDELLAATGRVAVLWLGDYHSSVRLHALQATLLTELQATGRPLLLALEAIGSQDEPLVARYLAGDLPLTTVRERMRHRWPESWLDDPALDPWHYQWLLTFARTHTLEVVALEPTPRPPLGARDARIAARVARLIQDHPRHLVVVVVGQAHLLGDGAQLARCAAPQLALGGVPPSPLLAAAPAERAFGSLHRSSGGLWWFAELLAAPR